MRGAKDCREQALLGYLEGDLNPRERRGMEIHLASCASCREQVTGMAATLSRVGKGPTPRLDTLYSGGLLFRVRQGIRARQTRASRRQWGLRAAGIAGAIGLLALFLWPRGGGEVPAPRARLAGSPTSEVDLLADAAGMADLIESYLLQTGSTEELLAEVGNLEVDDELLAFSEDE